jgi:hypothetical protein
MNHRLETLVGPFALLVLASCGSSSGGETGDGHEAGPTAPGDDASPQEDAGGDDATGSNQGGHEGGVGNDAGPQSEAGSPDSADVPMMHKHINRDGLFVDGKFTKAALAGKTMKIDATFAGTVVGNAYASPLYVEDGVAHKGTFYVATESNNVYALDETTGKSVITSKNAGTPAGTTGCAASNIHPLGITGTPAIDLATRTIVFDAGTATAANGVLSEHTIHAWSIDDFSEKWSFKVSTLKDPVAGSFPPATQNQRSAVLIVGGVAYVTYGGHYGDCEPYHGWIVGIPLDATAANVASLVKFYATPAREAGMWAPGGPSSDGTSIFAATGNTPDTDPTGTNWMGGYSVLRFGAGPTFTLASTNYWHALKAVNDDTGGDDDLGGSAPLVVDAPSITPSKLLVQLGKDQHAYTIDRTTMGGETSPVGFAKVMTGDISNAAAWANTPSGTFVAMVSNGGAGGSGCMTGSGSLVVISLSATAQITVPWCADNKGGGSPSITSSDGTNDMLVWTMGTDGGNTSNQIHAWDLAKGTPVITASDTVAGTRHFTTPIFVHGRAFVVGDNRLFALAPK